MSFLSVETKNGAVWRLREELASTQNAQKIRTAEPVSGPSATEDPTLRFRNTSPPLSHRAFPQTSVVDNSDSHPLSPWSRKVILSLGILDRKNLVCVRTLICYVDGGGIRVYTSLLILRNIMDLVASIESNSQPEEDVSILQASLPNRLVTIHS